MSIFPVRVWGHLLQLFSWRVAGGSTSQDSYRTLDTIWGVCKHYSLLHITQQEDVC